MMSWIYSGCFFAQATNVIHKLNPSENKENFLGEKTKTRKLQIRKQKKTFWGKNEKTQTAKIMEKFKLRVLPQQNETYQNQQIRVFVTKFQFEGLI